MPQPIAQWNNARGVWETYPGGVDMFCGHSEPYSATLPTSGMTRGGQLWPLPTPVPPTGDAGCSSSPALPTPMARDGKGRAINHRDGGLCLTGAVQTMPDHRTDPTPDRPRSQ